MPDSRRKLRYLSRSHRRRRAPRNMDDMDKEAWHSRFLPNREWSDRVADDAGCLIPVFEVPFLPRHSWSFRADSPTAWQVIPCGVDYSPIYVRSKPEETKKATPHTRSVNRD